MGKIRAIINDYGKNIEIGACYSNRNNWINGAAKSGDDFIVLPNEKEAKSLCEARVQESKDQKIPINFVTQDSAFQSSISEELNIIIKSDAHGSSEAIRNAIDQIKQIGKTKNTSLRYRDGNRNRRNFSKSITSGNNCI